MHCVHPHQKQQVDLNPKKFDMAVQLGATDCLNPKDFPDKPIQQVRGCVHVDAWVLAWISPYSSVLCVCARVSM